jgi:acetolactate synthase I/II/III large subunit
MPKMTGARCLAETLRGYGTSHIFFVPTVFLKALAAMEQLGMQPISAHGEKAAAYMADGYARVSGKPGICAAQTVGDANLMAGLKDAYMAGSPVIAMTGGSYPDINYRNVYQDTPDFPMFDAVTKWSAQVNRIERLPELLRQAFRASTAGAPGPVHLEFQGTLGDILDEEGDLEVIIENRFAQTPPFRPEPDLESVNEALAQLAAAERPVVVAGGGVIRSGAQAALVALAERLSIPVVTSLNAKAAIPDDHPLSVGVVGAYARRCANEVVTAADLVFYVGSHTGSMVTNIWRTPAIGAATVLHLDIDPVELGRVYPETVGMMGDARAGLDKLLAESTPRENSAWVEQAQAKVRAWRQKVEPNVNSDAVPIRQERIMGELSALLPDDAVVVVDTLQASQWTGSYLALTSPQQQYIRCAGSLGWGLPAAIGAKCAAGDRPVVCVTGDGGLYYHIAELETAARHEIPLVVLVNNNGAYAGERLYWRNAFAYEETGNEAPDMWAFGSRNFAKIATEMGCVGIRVENPSEIGDAIKEGFASGRPTLVDVVSDPSLIADKGW